MNNPYILLGVDSDATDEQIRVAWLNKVHQYPPETEPEKFKTYRDAYDKIDTRQKRVRHYLFSHECYISSPFESLLTDLHQKADRQPPSSQQLEAIIKRTYEDIYTKKSQ